MGSVTVSADSPHYRFRNVVIGGDGEFVPGIISTRANRTSSMPAPTLGAAYRWNPEAGRWTPLLDWIGPDGWNLTGVESIATDASDPRRF